MDYYYTFSLGWEGETKKSKKHYTVKTKLFNCYMAIIRTDNTIFSDDYRIKRTLSWA